MTKKSHILLTPVRYVEFATAELGHVVNLIFQFTTPTQPGDGSDVSDDLIHTTTTTPPLTTKKIATTTATATVPSSNPTSSDSCIGDAVVCLEDVYYVFSGSDVIIYNSIEDLTSVSGERRAMSSVFPGMTGVIAAYYNGTSYYLFTGKL